MRWSELPPSLDRSKTKWAVSTGTEGPPLPNRDALERVIRRRVPAASVSHVSGNGAVVELPFTVSAETRAMIGSDVRAYAQAQA